MIGRSIAMKRFSTVPSEKTITAKSSPGRVAMKRSLSSVRVALLARTSSAGAPDKRDKRRPASRSRSVPGGNSENQPSMSARSSLDSCCSSIKASTNNR